MVSSTALTRARGVELGFVGDGADALASRCLPELRAGLEAASASPARSWQWGLLPTRIAQISPNRALALRP